MPRQRRVGRSGVVATVTPDAIRTARERIGLSQAQLAARVGCSPAAVAMWELGTRRPTGLYAKALRAVLEAPMSAPVQIHRWLSIPGHANHHTYDVGRLTTDHAASSYGQPVLVIDPFPFDEADRANYEATLAAVPALRAADLIPGAAYGPGDLPGAVLCLDSDDHDDGRSVADATEAERAVLRAAAAIGYRIAADRNEAVRAVRQAQ